MPEHDLSLTSRPLFPGLLTGAILFIGGWVLIDPPLVKTVMKEIGGVCFLLGFILTMTFMMLGAINLAISSDATTWKEMPLLKDYGVEMSPSQIFLGFITGILLMGVLLITVWIA